MAHYAPFVVVHVAVSTASAFDLFDDSVEALGSSVGDPHLQEDQDRWPPSLDGLGKLDRFNVSRVGAGGVEVEESFTDRRGRVGVYGVMVQESTNMSGSNGTMRRQSCPNSTLSYLLLFLVGKHPPISC